MASEVNRFGQIKSRCWYQTPPIRSDIKHVPDQNTLQSPAPRMVSHKQMRKVSIEAEPDNLWVGADEEIAVEKSEVYHRSPIITV